MEHALPVALVAGAAADVHIREVARIMARLSYAMMCAALAWGLLINPAEDRRWFAKITGTSGKTAAHLVFATLALVFGAVHAAMFLLLPSPLPLIRLIVPFVDGGLTRHALGIIGIEVILLAALSVAVRRLLGIRRWLFVHRLVYPATILLIVHSALGAWVNADFVLLAPLGIVLLVPIGWLVGKRLVARYELRHENAATEIPSRRSDRLVVSVSHEHCHRYGFCQQEARQVFQLRKNGHLEYVAHPHPALNAQVRMAARSCPTQAITIDEV